MENFRTTFWQDFTIADKYGRNAINDTYRRAFGEWKSDYRYVTDLVMVLNHKIWQHWENKNNELAEVYDKLWRVADEWCMENLKGEELNYFLRTTD